MTTLRIAILFTSSLVALSACATTNPNVTATPDAAKGEIVLSEAVANTNETGGRAAIAIGSAIVGALVPGPWGSVAGIATGQAGNVAISNTNTGSMRYHVRLEDGTVQAFDQSQAQALPAGTPVDIITMTDGSKRIVPAKAAAE